MVKKALVVELNPYHGEIIPGFTHLLQEGGYSVDVLMREEVAKESPLARMPADRMPYLKSGSLTYIKQELQPEKTRHYDTILFSTNVLWEKELNISSVFRYLGFIPVCKTGSLFMEHNLSYLDKDDSTLLFKKNRVGTLLPYGTNKAATLMVNPHYFGDIAERKKPHQKKRIVVIGTSSRERYSLNILFYAVRNNSEAEFEITIINGEGIDVPADIRDKVTTTPRLDFKNYYRHLENADFLLTLFGSDNTLSDKYLTGTTSGTVQISLGFCKPMIIDRAHAGKYGFSDNESIQFDFNDVSEGLKKALQISAEEYGLLCTQIKRKSNEFNAISVSNLMEMIDIMRKEGKDAVEAVDRDSMTIAQKNKELEEARRLNDELQRKVNDQEKIITDLKREAQDLRIHVNTLWVHLHSKRFLVADKIYKYVNRIAPSGSVQRKVGTLPIKAARYVKNSPTRKQQRLEDKFREDFKLQLREQAKNHDSIVVYISMPWDNIMRQRPHHLAEQLAKLGHLVVYMDYEALLPRKVSENLAVVDSDWCFDVLEEVETPKFFMLPAGYNMPYEQVRAVTDKGFSLIYEYIDELDETISGDLTNQIEVFKKLDELSPAILIASAKKLHKELKEKFPKNNVLMNANAVDPTHFNSKVKRLKKDAPIDLKSILQLGKPIVGYYGAMAPWLDYALINEITHKRQDLSFVFIGVNYNDGLKDLLMYDNVFYLGPKDYNDLPNYSYWFDAAIIPFRQGEIAKSTSPVKLFEYMAMALPTVCTADLEECKGYKSVYISKDVDEFERNIQKAINQKAHPKSREALAAQAGKNTWKARAKDISNAINDLVKKRGK